MSKKIWFASAVLLLGLSLAACSSDQKQSATNKETSLKVTETQKQEEKITSKWKNLKESSVTYLSEAEIEAIQTVSDVKKTFQSLSKAYSDDFSQLIKQMPAEAQDDLKPYEEQVNTALKQQQDLLEQQLSSLDDETVIDGEGLKAMVDSLKFTRQQFIQAMDLAYQQADDLIEQTK